VPPLREAELREVVSKPAATLSARFETKSLAADVARRTAEESTKDAGALPLLSYLLDDMWTHMVQRGDGVLRLPAKAVELGGVLAERADAFVASRPTAEGALRRLLTLKLATVRPDGEPSRRRALRSEFTDEEWYLVSELADHPHRLLITATPDGGETYAEVAHEAIFRRWEKLRQWISEEREFLAWRSEIEAARARWESAAAGSDALLMGRLALAQAKDWMEKRPGDLPPSDRKFIDASLEFEAAEQRQKERLRAHTQILWTSLILLVAVAVAALAWSYQFSLKVRTASLLDAQFPKCSLPPLAPPSSSAASLCMMKRSVRRVPAARRWSKPSWPNALFQASRSILVRSPLPVFPARRLRKGLMVYVIGSRSTVPWVLALRSGGR
jgi:hypothetical protein